jgi:hypothetical protein
VIWHFAPTFQLPPLGEVMVIVGPVMVKPPLVFAQELMVVLVTLIW